MGRWRMDGRWMTEMTDGDVEVLALIRRILHGIDTAETKTLAMLTEKTVR